MHYSFYVSDYGKKNSALIVLGNTIPEAMEEEDD